MVGRGWFDVLHTKCSPALIFGLMLAFSSHVPASTETRVAAVRCRNLTHQHCVIHPDGVHDLDCFGSWSQTFEWRCVWKPGEPAAEKTYTLIIQQPKKKWCRLYPNITALSQTIKIFNNYNLSAEVLENSPSTNCSRAVFKGLPANLQRCGPPHSASFRRHAGMLNMTVKWPLGDSKHITNYTVRYKEVGSHLWSKSPVAFHNKRCRLVEHLNSSSVYVVQIQCVPDNKCSQCPWSDAFTVPSELTTPPVIVGFKDNDIAKKNGRRLVTLTWKSSATEIHDSFSVMIAKASGESPELISTSWPEIRLILSYSAYQVNISGVNNASISPAVSQLIPQREGVGDVRLNVTVHSNTSFTIYWRDDLIRTFVCFSVEWWKKGQKVTYMSFYESDRNHKTLHPKGLEPYQRYSITLHTRPNKDTCNMKHINNSESTYSTAHFYSVQGSPVSAPTNISSHNVTLDSVELQWGAIPEEDIRGFLLGYTIHYTEYQQGEASTENNVIVDPELNNYKLENLISSTTYRVQISGFTSAGVGVRSEELLFKTNREDFISNSVITMLAVLTTLLIFGSPILKRAKVLLWPSIPNPRKSNALQKIDRPCELELLGAIDTLKVEERDTESLQLVEKVAATPASTSPSTIPLLHHSGDETDSAGATCNWMQTDTGSMTGDFMSDEFKTLDTQRTVVQSSPLTFSSEYTTIEMFQQAMPQPAPSVLEAEAADVTVVPSRMDYIRQFSSSPTSEGEHLSTVC
ncbi:protein sidekick-1 isoform X2 [Parambassis ranga]|uniref:Protein sidekick-1 isoform X2 n=1 Tax=Parambassis ranga TaxID=210632 RepID=A0A6P7J9H5_9TELE|nr:protein sidekick-1-like isoform X2 [Parambassis ranga]